MILRRFSFLMQERTGLAGRWKLWALCACAALVASIGTWLTGQYQIGRLDSLKNRYDQPVSNYAKYYADCADQSLERDLLEGCKQAQIGTWLQTTEALSFDGPLTGNRVSVRLDPENAYIDLNGRELSECIQDEVEDRQFDIGSMTNTWAIVLMLAAFCLGVWAWVSRKGVVNAQKSRNIYAETLAEAAEQSTDMADSEGGNDSSQKEPPLSPPLS